MAERSDLADQPERRLRQLLRDRVARQGHTTAAAAAAHVGVLTGTVRRVGHAALEQGQPERARVALQLATSLQRLHTALSETDPQRLVGDLRRVPARDRVSLVVAAGRRHAPRVAQLRVERVAPDLAALNQVLADTSALLDQQGHPGSAATLWLLTQRTQPLVGYLSAADVRRLSSDIARHASRVPATAVSLKAAAAGAAHRAEQGAVVRRYPVAAAAGLVTGGAVAVLVARRFPGQQATQPAAVPAAPTPQAPQVGGPDPQGPAMPLPQQEAALPVSDADPALVALGGVDQPELEQLTRAQLREHAAAVGVRTDSKMTRKKLIEVIRDAG